MSIYLLDFEASSLLPGSYPIEVAWVNYADFKQRGRDAITSHLIQPTETWIEKGVWSPESEIIHGISLETLLNDGLPAEIVANSLLDLIGKPDVHIFSDAPTMDANWANTLLACSSQPRRLQLKHLNTLLEDFAPGGLAGAAVIEEAAELAKNLAPATHRATDDVEHMATMLHFLENPEAFEATLQSHQP